MTPAQTPKMTAICPRHFDKRKLIQMKSFEDQCVYFNKFHGQIYDQFYIKANDGEMPYFTMMNVQSFKTTYIQIKKFLKEWLESINRHTFNRMIYDPTKRLLGFNIFTGYKWNYFKHRQSYPLSTGKDVNVILNHINHLCGGEGIDYFYHWFYRLVCQPEMKPTVALVFNGIQGCGKSFFWRMVGNYILGNDLWKSISSVKKLMGKFSGAYLKSRLLVMEEANMKDSKEHTEMLKNNITNIEMEIQQKFKDEHKIRNYSGHVFLTNKDIPLIIQKNDRRFCVYSCNPESPNWEYFQRLEKAFQNPDAILCVLTYIGLKVNMKKWHIEKDRYFSDKYKMIIEVTGNDWFDHFLNEVPKEEISASQLLARLKEEIRDNGWGRGQKWSSMRLGLKMKDYKKIPKFRKRSGNYYDFSKFK
jgi:hypothetical protein